MNRPNVAKLLKIGDKYVVGIAKYHVDMEDIDSEETTRDETGEMHRKPLRKKVKKLSVTCTQDDDEVLSVATLVEDDTFEATLFCPGDPSASDFYVTSTFYVTKISIDLMRFRDNKGVWSVSFNAVEV